MSDRSADEELSCCSIARVPRLAHKEVCQFGPAFLQLALENEVPLGIDEAKIALQPSLRGDLAIAPTSTRSRKMKRIGLDHRHRSAVWCRQKRAGLCQHCSAGCVRTPPIRGTIRGKFLPLLRHRSSRDGPRLCARPTRRAVARPASGSGLQQ